MSMGEKNANLPPRLRYSSLPRVSLTIIVNQAFIVRHQSQHDLVVESGIGGVGAEPEVAAEDGEVTEGKRRPRRCLCELCQQGAQKNNRMAPCHISKTPHPRVPSSKPPKRNALPRRSARQRLSGGSLPLDSDEGCPKFLEAELHNGWSADGLHGGGADKRAKATTKAPKSIAGWQANNYNIRPHRRNNPARTLR